MTFSPFKADNRFPGTVPLIRMQSLPSPQIPSIDLIFPATPPVTSSAACSEDTLDNISSVTSG